jgi:RNA polymerase sigma factor (sigma-70 family)
LDLNKLVEECLAGDRRAQKEFYDSFAPFILGVCARYLAHRMEAEDAMILSLHKALMQMDRLRDRSNLKGWLRRIAVNECLMLLRKKHMQIVDPDQVSIHSPDPNGLTDLLTNDILSMLQYLPTGYRTIFNLYVLEGYTHKEIGELLGISLNTSKSQLIQARKKLAAMMGIQNNFTA